MKYTKILILLFLISNVQAVQDVNITMRNTKGLCFYSLDTDCQYCDNETFTLSGTEDHIIHLASQKPYSNCGVIHVNSTSTISEYFNPDFLTEALIAGVFFIFFLGWVTKKRGGF